MPPAIIGATGGSGSRALRAALVAGGGYFGSNVNRAGDAIEFFPLYDQHINPTLVAAGSLDYRLAELPAPVREAALGELRRALAAYRAGIDPSAPAWGIKGPRSMFMLPYFASELPAFVFLHLIRDGRDMALSRNRGQMRHYAALFGEPPRQPMELAAARLWTKANMEVADWAEANLAGRYRRIRYEDLCRRPREELAAVLDFLGWPVAGADVDRMALEVRPAAGIGRWQGADPDLGGRIEEIARPALIRFGYSRSRPLTPP